MRMGSHAYVLHLMQDHLYMGLLAVSTLLLIRCSLTIKHYWTFIQANCWFCNTDCRIQRKYSDWWKCKNCEQYNGFNEDGDYLHPIKDMYKWVSTSKKQGSITEKTLLCKLCNAKQEKKINELACFQPSYEECFDFECEQFELFLTEKYKLCSTCDIRVTEELARQNKHVLETMPTQNPIKGYEAINPIANTGDYIIDNEEHNDKLSVCTNSLVTPDLLNDHLGSMYIQERLEKESRKAHEKQKSANFLLALHESAFNNNCGDSFDNCSLQSNINTGNDCGFTHSNTWKAFAHQHSSLPETLPHSQSPLLKPATLNIQHLTHRQPALFSNAFLSSHNGTFSAQCHQIPFLPLYNAHWQSIANKRSSVLVNGTNNFGYSCTLDCSGKVCQQSTTNESFLQYRSSSENKKQKRENTDEEEDSHDAFQQGKRPVHSSTSSNEWNKPLRKQSLKSLKTKHNIKQQNPGFGHAGRSYNLCLFLCACLLISMLVNAYYIVFK